MMNWLRVFLIDRTSGSHGRKLTHTRAVQQEHLAQKTSRSCALPPTRCQRVARIVLPAPLSSAAVALHRGSCDTLLRYGKLATSSISGGLPAEPEVLELDSVEENLLSHPIPLPKCAN